MSKDKQEKDKQERDEEYNRIVTKARSVIEGISKDVLTKQEEERFEQFGAALYIAYIKALDILREQEQGEEEHGR